MSSALRWVITCPLHIEKLLDQELRSLGYKDVKPSAGKVSLEAPLEAGFQICLWSRLAHRVLLQLGEWDGKDGDSIYQNAREFTWRVTYNPTKRLRSVFTGPIKIFVIPIMDPKD